MRMLALGKLGALHLFMARRSLAWLRWPGWSSLF